MKTATKLIHTAQQPDQLTGALSPPLFQTSTFRHERPGEHLGFDYTRTNNPNREQLEAVLAELEGVPYAAVFATGLAAEHAVLEAHLPPASEIVLPRDVYGGTYRLVREVFTKRGALAKQCDFSDLETLGAELSERTQIVWLETPTNPRLQVYDIEAIARVAHANEALVVVDNTFATPLYQLPFRLGADVVVHSVTKYLSGHLDVVQGVALAKDASVFAPIRFLQNAVGATPSPFDCWLSLRGLRSLDLRLSRQSHNAHRIAQYLERAPKVLETHYPGLTTHPAHQLAKRQMSGFGAVVSIELDASAEDIHEFVSRRRLFVLAESLGGIKSLICQPATMTHASIPTSTRRRLKLSERLVRLSVGCEDADDLIQDLEDGLRVLLKSPSSPSSKVRSHA